MVRVDDRATRIEDIVSAPSTGGGAAPPAVRAYHSERQTVSGSASTTVAFDGERLDPEQMHAERAHNSRLTAQAAGRYLILGTLTFAPDPVGHRQASIVVSGRTVVASQSVVAERQAPTSISVATVWQLSLGDYIELRAARGPKGPDLDLLPEPELMMVRIW